MVIEHSIALVKYHCSNNVLCDVGVVVVKRGQHSITKAQNCQKVLLILNVTATQVPGQEITNWITRSSTLKITFITTMFIVNSHRANTWNCMKFTWNRAPYIIRTEMSGTMGRTWGLVWRREFLAASVESRAKAPAGFCKNKMCVCKTKSSRSWKLSKKYKLISHTLGKNLGSLYSL